MQHQEFDVVKLAKLCIPKISTPFLGLEVFNHATICFDGLIEV